MIGPGTGIAPFRGFVQAREVWQKEGKQLGEAHLYFGCRHPEEDDLYFDEMQLAAQKELSISIVLILVTMSKKYMSSIC